MKHQTSLVDMDCSKTEYMVPFLDAEGYDYAILLDDDDGHGVKSHNETLIEKDVDEDCIILVSDVLDDADVDAQVEIEDLLPTEIFCEVVAEQYPDDVDSDELVAATGEEHNTMPDAVKAKLQAIEQGELENGTFGKGDIAETICDRIASGEYREREYRCGSPLTKRIKYRSCICITVMPPGWFEEVRPSVKEGTRDIIERIQTDTDLPTETFHRLTSGSLLDTTTEFEVPVPGQILEGEDVFDELYHGEFEEVSQTIHSNLPDPQRENAYSKEERIESIERTLFEFAGIVLNYAGELKFDDDAFEAAFNQQFEPRFTDRVRSRFLLCLKNTLVKPEGTINLETDLQGNPEYLGPYKIESLRIRNLDDLEETGIATFEAPRGDVFDVVETLDASQPNPILEIVLYRRRPFREIAQEIDGNIITPWPAPEFDITPVDAYLWQQITDVIRYIATTVRRCLRLQCPRGTVGFEKGYYVHSGWTSYRGIAIPVTYQIDFECPSEALTHIGGARAPETERLWKDYRHQLRPEDSTFQNPLSRFERMFSRENTEDQLVDCTVGCETTLLKGGSPGGNQYRLGLRAAALLGEHNSRQWSGDKVGEFFRTVYHRRNSVVHEDKSLPDEPSAGEFIKVNGDEFLGRTFLVHARELYADVLLSYLKLTTTDDRSIKQINDRIDRLLLEQAAEIRDELF